MPPDLETSANAPARLQQLSQDRYERSLLQEISKLQTALLEERTATNAHRAQVEAEVSAERNRKLSESEKASRLAAMEKAIEAAQKGEQRDFLRKREEADKRFQAKEANAAKERRREARKKEEHRELAHKLHEETKQRAQEERAQAEESKRMADQRKEAKLRARLAAEREALQERNLRKAEESAEKVERAAEQRKEMTASQREQYQLRVAGQQERMAAQKNKADRRQAEVRVAAQMKAQVIERAQENMRALEEKRKNDILNHDAEKTRRLNLKSAREAAAREQLMHEKALQEAAARSRVERTLSDRQAQLSGLEGQLDARQGKLDNFVVARERHMSEGQRLSVASALERQALANSMNKMRENLSNKGTLYLEVPANRRNVQSRELKALLSRVDPDGLGHISLSSMKRTLNKLLPPDLESSLVSPAAPKPKMSTSLPSLLTLEQKEKLSQYEQYVAAFQAVDVDGSGTISKRELYDVLKQAGLANGKQALEVFEGFDKDSDGQLDFEEFTRIAKILC